MLSIRNFTIWSLIAILSSSLISCEDSSTLGLNLQPDQLQVTTKYVDTLELEVGSVWFDSIPSFNVSRLLVGRVESADFGVTKATAYAQPILLTEDTLDIFGGIVSSTEIEDSVYYDSLTLRLSYSYTDGDVDLMATQKFFVHELSADIDTTEGKDVYTFNSIPKGDLLGEVDFQPTDSTDFIEVKLDDVLGETLYDAGLNKNITSSEDVQALLRGIIVSTDDNGQAIYGVNTLTVLTRLAVHFHYINDGDTTNSTFVFVLGNRFHQVEVDRTGTDLEGLAEGQFLSSKTTGNAAFLQAATGLYTYVRVPDMITDFSLENKRAINRAEFLMRPIEGSVDDQNIPPAVLELLLATADRQISRNEDDVLVFVTDDVSRTVINYNGNGQGYFPFTFTSYIEDLANGEETNTGFFISPEAFNFNNNALYNTTTSRLRLGDRAHIGVLPMQLRIYYTEFK